MMTKINQSDYEQNLIDEIDTLRDELKTQRDLINRLRQYCTLLPMPEIKTDGTCQHTKLQFMQDVYEYIEAPMGNIATSKTIISPSEVRVIVSIPGTVSSKTN